MGRQKYSQEDKKKLKKQASRNRSESSGQNDSMFEKLPLDYIGPGASPEMSQRAILQMQRERGNLYVSNLVNPSSKPPAVQRGDPDEEQESPGSGTDPGNATLSIGEVRLLPLLEYTIMITNPPTMNQSAVNLMGKLREAGTQSSDLRSELGYLGYAGEHQGEDLGAVQSASGDLAAASRGRQGAYLRSAIQNYTAGNNRVRSQLSNVEEKQIAIQGAVQHLHTVTVEGQIQDAEQQESEAAENVASIQADISRATALAQGLIDPVANLLQGKWVEFGIDLAKFVGKELVGMDVAAAYSGSLHQAEAQLAEIRTNLATFRSQRQASALQEAATALRGAKQAANTAQNELMTQVWLAEEAHTTLVEELNRMGYTDAASALDNRASVMERSASATMRLRTYRELIADIARHAQNLGGLNSALADLMTSPGGPAAVPVPADRTDLFLTGQHNSEELGQVTEWANGELVSIGTAEGMVEGGSYMESYNEIDTVLHQALVYR